MAVPKKKLTRTRQGNRRSHQALKIKKLVRCSRCQSFITSHQACHSCGSYRDEEIKK